jgi:hypothetical protein
MANADARSGLSPIGHLDGASWNGKTMRCYCAVGNSDVMYIGDAVDIEGGADTDATSPTIKLASAGATNGLLGVIVSFEPVTPGDHGNINLQRLYRPTLTAMYANVCVDPTVVYEIQGDSVAVIGAVDVGLNANLIFTHSGNTVTGLSGMELNSSSKGADSTYQLTILGASKAPDNDISTVNAKWLVMINLHRLFASGVNTAGAALAGGVGVS